jgi:hypothetical protein
MAQRRLLSIQNGKPPSTWNQISEGREWDDLLKQFGADARAKLRIYGKDVDWGRSAAALAAAISELPKDFLGTIDEADRARRMIPFVADHASAFSQGLLQPNLHTRLQPCRSGGDAFCCCRRWVGGQSDYRRSELPGRFRRLVPSNPPRVAGAISRFTDRKIRWPA